MDPKQTFTVLLYYTLRLSVYFLFGQYNNNICFALFFFSSAYTEPTKHLPRCRRIIFYSPSIVRCTRQKRFYECAHLLLCYECVFHRDLPNFSNFIDVLQTFKYYDPAPIFNRDVYYECKIRIYIYIKKKKKVKLFTYKIINPMILMLNWKMNKTIRLSWIITFVERLLFPATSIGT
jgi:hypothetical protein